LEQGPFQEEFLGEGPGDSRIEYRAWQQRREAAVTSGERPEFTIARISEIRESPRGERPVLLELIDPPIGRVGGRRFGTLVHALLRDIPLDAGQPQIAEMARLHARLLGSTEAEIESAVETAVAALRHPLLHRARQASRCERELPVMLHDGGQLLEGVADLAFLEPAGWQVVDFKTGDDLGSRRAQYEAQVRWYAEALERLTGHPAHAVLLAL
jgi:ATP-dependent exoDNAse (exonuclease V) beta subunit